MKKKIIFMIINMNVGGTERALLNLIDEMPEKDYEITILMLEEYGGFLEAIPSRVHRKYVDDFGSMKDILNNPPRKVLIDLLKKGQLWKSMRFFYIFLFSKITKNRRILFKYVLKDYPMLMNDYDTAVAYAGPMDFISYFVVHKIKAKKKIQWIHFDVTKIGFSVNFASKIYREYDKVFIVSKEAKEKLIGLIPSISSKVEVFVNWVSPRLVYSESRKGKGFNDHFDGHRILTVGRLSLEKGQDLAIKAFSRLINDGYNIKWYCIGEGISRKKYETIIEKYNLQNNFILLGSNSNPYPYIDQCDIYVQPSRYEGYCITLIEARILAKPIVTTNVNGAKEQIRNEETGLIVDIHEEQIYYAVKELIDKPKKRRKFSVNLSNDSINRKNEIKKHHTL